MGADEQRITKALKNWGTDMRKYSRAAPPGEEICIFLYLCVGLAIAVSLLAIFVVIFAAAAGF